MSEVAAGRISWTEGGSLLGKWWARAGIFTLIVNEWPDGHFRPKIMTKMSNGVFDYVWEWDKAVASLAEAKSIAEGRARDFLGEALAALN